MALLSSMMRTAAVTGRPDQIDYTWFANRQGRRWAQQTVQKAMPTRGPQAQTAAPAPAPRDAAQTLRELDHLRSQGVLTDAEAAQLRARLGV